MVGDPKLIVKGVTGGRFGELGREPDLSEGLRDDGREVPVAFAMDAIAHGRVESAYAVLAMSEPRGSHDPHRAPGRLHEVDVLPWEFAAVIEHRK